ncbi:uncharacterized protein P174DRAFT_456633 [Aspergillus novofumigatus IBT 16806]|uniref:Transmembrane protein n=1 Tax=Aspergillus novofumigatus (strain IBT 16806) TaxID=1392255 RepID=A0A2I1CN95_ASPN1|nr:uncharacterized protein P174DRAFT_456633 [Aspergillus novofumigatus IBT 16806]PKX99065.1 hypothetical protein P174DRAFT_456633 [Aspergillus novofumigatus IBT 16806]
MCLQDGAFPLWHIFSAFLCTSISVLSQPAGHVAFIDDLKVNAAFLSPITGALWSLRTVFGVIGCRVSNLADLRAALWIASEKEFQSHGGPYVMSALGRGPRNSYVTARWVFFVLVSLPLYLRLVYSVQIWWATTWATCLIVKFLLLELLTRYYDPPRTRILVHTTWPEVPLITLSSTRTPTEPSKSDQSSPVQGKEVVAEKSIDPNDAKALLPLCTRIEKFCSVVTESPDDAERSRMTPVKDFYLRKALNHESLDPRLCCAHTRCRLFKLFHILGHSMPYLSLALEALVVLYLGHQNLRTITVLASGWIMRPRWVMFAVSLGTRITVVLLLPIFLGSVVMAVLRVRGPATEVTFARRLLEVMCLTILAVVCVVYFLAFGYPPVSPFAFAWVGEVVVVPVILVAGFQLARWLVRGPPRRNGQWSTGEEWRTISDEKKVADDPPLLEHLFVFAWTVVFVIPAVVVWVVKTVFCAAIALQEAEIQRRFEEYYERPGF